MIAVFVFMVAFFAAMGVVSAAADSALRRRRRRRNGRSGAGPSVRRPTPAPPPRAPTRADETLLMAEIEEWMRQQQ